MKLLKENIQVNMSDYESNFPNLNSAVYVAVELTYSLVYNAQTALRLYKWAETTGFTNGELLALDDLIANALEGANEHDAMKDYCHSNINFPISWAWSISDNDTKLMDELIKSCKTVQQKRQLLFIAINVVLSEF